ncbi:hypothetical protein Fmac_024824 [Flemingia macrophylla]|uniref:Uncharacterized protein n=1 Tax=Flemingia macrophylla TaxID=520843 RepID=A0ABD1LQI2_9FABA
MASNPSSVGAGNDAIVIRGFHDVATETSAETRKVEGKVDALVKMVTQLAVNQKHASVVRVYGIRSSKDHHTNRRWLPTPSSFGVRNDAIAIRGAHDVATDTSAETRKVEGKLDTLVNLVTQLVMNLKPASVARQSTTVGEARHLTGKTDFNSKQFQCKNDSIVIRGVHDVATYTSAETRKMEGKLDALVNLVSQLVVNQKPPLLKEYVASVLPVEGKQDALVNLVTQLAVNQKPTSVARVCDIRSSNDHHTNRRWLPIPSSFSARNDALVIRVVHDVATDTSVETRKVERKLDTLVNLVTQLAVNQKHASLARRRWLPTPISFSKRNDAIVIRVLHDVATNTSAVTRKVEGKLDALVNLVTQLAVNQKPTSVARVCGIRSSNDHHTNVCPSLVQPGVSQHPEAYPANIYSRTPQQQRPRKWLPIPSSFSARNDAIVIRGVHDVATDTFAETRKEEGNLDALVNLVTQLAVNQKRASIARDCGIRSSNNHHTNATTAAEASHLIERWLPTPRSFSARNDAIVIRGVHEDTTDTSAETRKVEGKLDALVNLVTQLAMNHKHASVARVCGVRSSHDNHTNRRWLLTPSSFSARNDAIVIRGVHDVAIDTSAETRNAEGKLDAIVKLVTQLAVNQKHASAARVSCIRSSNDHHSNVCPSSQQPGVNEHHEAYAANIYSRPPQQLRPDT